MKLPQPIVRVVRAVGLRYLLARELIDRGVAFNPLDRRYSSDPYPLYRKLREKDRVHRSRLFDGYVVSGYEEVQAALKDPRLSADDRKGPRFQTQQRDALRAGALTEEEAARKPAMLRSDPPDHTRLRSLVNRAFTPRAVESLRPRVEEIVEELLDAASERGSLDVIRDLAYPLPVIVIAEMLGIPAADRDRFKRWSDLVAKAVEFSADFTALKKARVASRELWSYLEDIAEDRRREPREDLLSALLVAEQAGDKLTAEEVFTTTELLLIAGNETTTNLIGNGLLALLHAPDQLQALRDDEALLPAAIEELLRFDSPVQATARLALDDLEVGSMTLKKGQELVLLLGAANRDPAQFEDPDQLDLHRQDVRHLSFSQGIHYCIGAPLARLEAPIALGALLRSFPDLRLDPASAPQWRGGFVLRGLERLPVLI